MVKCWLIIVAQRVNIDTLANDISESNFRHYLDHFLHDQLKLDHTLSSPFFYIPDKIHVYSSTIATFYTPSNLCGTGGMHCECIHAITSWRCGKPQYDCVFVNTDELAPIMLGLNVTQARLFFSVTVNCIKYSCALVHWYSQLGDSVDENTGMWVIEPNILDDGRPRAAVIHLDMIVRLVHLLPIYGEERAPRGVKYTDSLDTFSEFYVNKFADHHAFEITF